MSNALKRLQVFLSSPGDVTDERGIVRAVIDQLNSDPLLKPYIDLDVIAWDDPDAPIPMPANLTPQEAVNRSIPKPSECDIVIVIFWSRMGTPLDPDIYGYKDDGTPYLSGTEYEYWDALNAARKKGTPTVLVYRRTEEVLVSSKDPDRNRKFRDLERVENFFSAFSSPEGYARLSFKTYEKPDDLRHLIEKEFKVMLREILDEKAVSQPAQMDFVEWKESPFPGLRSLTPEDAPIFFGRGREVDALIKKVAENRFVAVVGASGSGKSSLVGAGLLPRLKTNAISSERMGSKFWLPVTFRVGANPFDSLASALLTQLPGPSLGLAEYHEQRDKLARMLEDNPSALVDTCAFALRDQSQWAEILFFIDQFEELFTITPAGTCQETFVKLLGNIAEASRVRAVVTVRADFYHRCVELPTLARLLETGQYPLSPPSTGALYEMITRPAERAAVLFEEGLQYRILEDTGTEPGALALMAYALNELYHACEADRTLTYQAYEQLGGVHGAIGKKAERAFSGLDKDVQAQFSYVFRELVEVTEQGTVTRRRAPYARAARDEQSAALINALTDARLFVQAQANSGQPVIEIAHEALLNNWERLAEWIDDTREFLFSLRQVRNAAREWDEVGRRPDYLWSHERLEPIYKAQERLEIEFDPVVQAFIRPEADRLLEEFRLPDTPEHRKQTIIDRLSDFGSTSVSCFIRMLALEDDLSHVLDNVYAALVKIGDQAVPPLIAALESPDAKTRARVAKALGLIGDKTAIPALTDMLTDESDNILNNAASEAAKALAAIGDPSVVPALIQALDDWRQKDEFYSSFVKAEIVEILGSFADPLILPVMLEALEDEDESVRANAVTVLGKLQDKSVASRLVDMLKDESSDVREATIEALGKLGDPCATEPLINVLLHDTQQGLFSNPRSKAAVALAVIGDERAISPLGQALRDNKDYVRLSAAKALIIIGNSQAVPDLTKALEDNEDEIRATACEALAVIGDAKAVPALIKTLKDPEESVRNNAIEALGTIRDPRAIPALTEFFSEDDYFTQIISKEAVGSFGAAAIPEMGALLKHKSEEVRDTAASVIREIKDPSAITLLVELLHDRRDETKEIAASLLADISDTHAIPTLLRLLDDRQEDIRLFATEILGRIGDEQAIPALVKCLDDRQDSVRAAAVAALGRIGGAQVRDHLVNALNDRDSLVRVTAASTLGDSGDRQAIPALRGLIEDADEDVQNVAIQSLLRLGDVEILPHFTEMLRTSEDENDVAMADMLDSIEDPNIAIAFLNASREFLDVSINIRQDATRVLLESESDAARQVLEKMAATVIDQARYMASDESQNATVDMLESIDDPRAIFALQLVDEEETFGDELCQIAVDLLKGFDPDIVIAPMAQLLPKVDEWDRKEAIQALKALDDPRVISEIADLLQHQDPLVQCAAAEVMMHYGAAAGEGTILAFLSNPDSSIHDAAFKSIERLKTTAFIPELVPLISNDDWWLASKAADALGELGDTNVTPDLLTILQKQQDNPLIPSSVIRALGNLKDTRAVPALITQLEGSLWERSGGEAAAEALGKIGDPSAIPALEKALRYPEKDIRKAAAEALEKIRASEATQ